MTDLIEAPSETNGCKRNAIIDRIYELLIGFVGVLAMEAKIRFVNEFCRIYVEYKQALR